MAEMRHHLLKQDVHPFRYLTHLFEQLPQLANLQEPLDVISIVEKGRKPEYEEILTLIEKHQPDVLLLDEGLLASYAQEGKLSSLEVSISLENSPKVSLENSPISSVGFSIAY
ncbi:hypothetical protein [Paenibacillus popilliae]|uniref:hypothetical protein n=1 Tax=Paenibacillus popilliae TaxID=78057 RepID=UPI0002E05ED9|nr:hypothetical protein [Paenibacillus popilliae]